MSVKQPWEGIPAMGPILRPPGAAGYLGISKSQLYGMVAAGDLPRPIKIGVRAAGIPQTWLDAVIASRASEAMEAAA